MTHMTRLATALSSRPPRAAPPLPPGRILAWRLRRVTRIALQPLLELLDTLSQPRKPVILRLDTRRQRQQHLHHRPTPLRIDRLRLRALHTRSFATTTRDPASD